MKKKPKQEGAASNNSSVKKHQIRTNINPSLVAIYYLVRRTSSDIDRVTSWSWYFHRVLTSMTFLTLRPSISRMVLGHALSLLNKVQVLIAVHSVCTERTEPVMLSLAERQLLHVV